MPASKKLAVLAMINLFVLAITALVGEVGFLLFWQPNYRIRCERWWVGSGMTAGRPQVLAGLDVHHREQGVQQSVPDQLEGLQVAP